MAVSNVVAGMRVLVTDQSPPVEAVVVWESPQPRVWWCKADSWPREWPVHEIHMESIGRGEPDEGGCLGGTGVAALLPGSLP